METQTNSPRENIQSQLITTLNQESKWRSNMWISIASTFGYTLGRYGYGALGETSLRNPDEQMVAMWVGAALFTGIAATKYFGALNQRYDLQERLNKLGEK